MAWFKGTATDYKDMLSQIKNLAKDDHIETVTLLNGGTGYALGDTITLAGGTKYHEPELEVLSITSGDYVSGAAVNAGGTGYAPGDQILVEGGTYSVQAVLEVASVTGGVVTGLTIINPGIYSVQPTNPVATTTDGSGADLTVDLTFTAGTGIITSLGVSDAGVYTSQASNPVSQNTTSGGGTGVKVELTYQDTAWAANVDFAALEAKTVTIATAGSGYAANDIVTVGGGSFTVPATVKILTVAGGVPTSIQVNTPGEYITAPADPAVTSGVAGSGLTVNLTWGAPANETAYLMLENANSGQHIGWKAFKWSDPDDAYLFRCAGFTGFNSVATPWNQQPGATGAVATYVPLSGGASPATIYYWMSIQDERIVAVFKVGSVYPSMYLGGIDPFMTQVEYGYPQLIMGSLTAALPYTYGGLEFAGMNNPGCANSKQLGPGVLRLPDGSLDYVHNWYLDNGNPTGVVSDITIQPSQSTDKQASGDNNWYDYYQTTWAQMFGFAASIPSGQDYLGRLGGKWTLIPCTVVDEGRLAIYGNMIGVFAINPDGLINSEDRIYVGSEVYRCFQNCGKSNRNFFFAVKEA